MTPGWRLISASTITREWIFGANRELGGSRVGYEFERRTGAQPCCRKPYRGRTSEFAGLVSDPQNGAVYISTTNELHRNQAIAAVVARVGVVFATNLKAFLSATKEGSPSVTAEAGLWSPAIALACNEAVATGPSVKAETGI